MKDPQSGAVRVLTSCSFCYSCVLREGAVLATRRLLSARIGALYLVLPGPILRKTEPGLVCVWVA